MQVIGRLVPEKKQKLKFEINEGEANLPKYIRKNDFGLDFWV